MHKCCSLTWGGVGYILDYVGDKGCLRRYSLIRQSSEEWRLWRRQVGQDSQQVKQQTQSRVNEGAQWDWTEARVRLEG